MPVRYKYGYPGVVLRAEDGETFATSIPMVDGNADYFAWLAWEEAGGVTEPAEVEQ